MNHAQKKIRGKIPIWIQIPAGPGLSRENGAIRVSAMNVKNLLTEREQNAIIIYVVGA